MILKVVGTIQSLDADASPIPLSSIRLTSILAGYEWYCEASFISKYSPTPIIIFVLDCPLNMCMLYGVA